MPCEPTRAATHHRGPSPARAPLHDEGGDDDKGPHDDRHRYHEPEPCSGPPPLRGVLRGDQLRRGAPAGLRDESVEFGAVLPEDFRLLLVAEWREPLVGEGFRVGPGRLGVWVVACPHDVVDANVITLAQPHWVFHEGAKHLPPEIVARWFGELALGPEAVLFPEMIGVVEEEGDPTDLTFDRDELELGVALHDQAVDELRHRFGHRQLAHHETRHESGSALEDVGGRGAGTTTADV